MSAVRDYWRMACPACGQDDDPQIVAEVLTRLLPCDTERVDGAREVFGPKSFCTCNACAFEGTVRMFRLCEQPRAHSGEEAKA
jgi:hypothetical protein